MDAVANSPMPHSAIDMPSSWVRRFAPLIPVGEVLDLACGSGRHSRLLASLGHPVLALDRNAESLAQAAGAGITTLQHDLESADEAARWPFAPRRFAGVVVTNYLFRPLLLSIVDSVAPGGVLIYETFAAGNAEFGKPSNPEFLLAHGELLALAQQYGLHVLAYEDGYADTPKPAMVQRLCAIKARAPFLAENLRLS
ncbi:MAG TPA: methyltransferase domain-containing protein [Oxalicibacterium sp.]|nr:methyltransferase domain-containing protein [Oxalicibacterium sp.]